jgi:hypothetical protein
MKLPLRFSCCWLAFLCCCCCSESSGPGQLGTPSGVRVRLGGAYGGSIGSGAVRCGSWSEGPEERCCEVVVLEYWWRLCRSKRAFSSREKQSRRWMPVVSSWERRPRGLRSGAVCVAKVGQVGRSSLRWCSSESVWWWDVVGDGDGWGLVGRAVVGMALYSGLRVLGLLWDGVWSVVLYCCVFLYALPLLRSPLVASLPCVLGIMLQGLAHRLRC